MGREPEDELIIYSISIYKVHASVAHTPGAYGGVPENPPQVLDIRCKGTETHLLQAVAGRHPTIIPQQLY